MGLFVLANSRPCLILLRTQIHLLNNTISQECQVGYFLAFKKKLTQVGASFYICKAVFNTLEVLLLL